MPVAKKAAPKKKPVVVPREAKLMEGHLFWAPGLPIAVAAVRVVADRREADAPYHVVVYNRQKDGTVFHSFEPSIEAVRKAAQEIFNP